jgi:peptidoglycan/LPS O-acetylase OafA/YrhL
MKGFLRWLSPLTNGPPAVLPPQSRLHGIDGLRALAECCILTYHCWIYSSPTGEPATLGPLSRFLLPHLPVGVSLFFALSGFLLCRPIAASLLRELPLPSIRRYLRNRALRILPAYWLILAVTGVVLPATLVRSSPSVTELGRLADQPAVLLKNIFLVHNYFRDSWETGIGPVWSLAIEMHFYLALPLLGLLAARLGRRFLTPRGRVWAALIPACALATIGLAGSVAASITSEWSNVYWHTVVTRGLLYHADLFALGIGLAVVHTAMEHGLLRLPIWWRRAASVGLLSTATLAVVLSDRGIIDRYQGALEYEALLSVSCTLLIALVALPGGRQESRPLVVRVFELRPIAAVGLASYSLFLWHEPVIRSLQRSGLTIGGNGGFIVNLVAASVLSGLLAALTYRYAEVPFLRRKLQPSRTTDVKEGCSPASPPRSLPAGTGVWAPAGPRVAGRRWEMVGSGGQQKRR